MKYNTLLKRLAEIMETISDNPYCFDTEVGDDSMVAEQLSNIMYEIDPEYKELYDSHVIEDGN